MVYNTQDSCGFGHCPLYSILKNTIIYKMVLDAQVKEGRHLLCWVC
jgi:hypothetical protein